MRVVNIFFTLIFFYSIFSTNHSWAAVSVGDSYGGGTVFCVSQTPDTTQCATTGSGCYGLIMANTDQVNYDSNPNHGITWSSVNSTTGATSFDNGATNTATIIAALPGDNASNNAAWAAHNYVDPTEGHTDWYLPSKNELNKMYKYANANHLIGSGCAGSKAGGVQCLLGGYFVESRAYWSSSEYSGYASLAWYQYFSNGGQGSTNKIGGYFGVRAVRAFNNLTIYPFTKSGYRDTILSFAAADFISCDGAKLSKIKVLSLPVNGTLKLSGIAVALNQEIIAADLDNMVYVPSFDWTGDDGFSWNGSNEVSYAAKPAIVNINVSAAVPITKSSCKNSVLSFIATDFTNTFSNLAKIKILSLPIYGTLKLGDVHVVLGQEIDTADLNNLVYVPNVNWAGNDSFSWVGSDGTSYSIYPVEVEITIINNYGMSTGAIAGIVSGAVGGAAAIMSGVVYSIYHHNKAQASDLKKGLLEGVHTEMQATQQEVKKVGEKVDGVKNTVGDAIAAGGDHDKFNILQHSDYKD